MRPIDDEFRLDAKGGCIGKELDFENDRTHREHEGVGFRSDPPVTTQCLITPLTRIKSERRVNQANAVINGLVAVVA